MISTVLCLFGYLRFVMTGVLNAGDICDYIDKNGISSNPNLNFLKSISPDDNPVVVFMEN